MRTKVTLCSFIFSSVIYGSLLLRSGADILKHLSPVYLSAVHVTAVQTNYTSLRVYMYTLLAPTKLNFNISWT